MDWTLFALGFAPIVFGLLTIAGLRIPGLRSYPKNSHKRPKVPLSRGETVGAGSFLIALGLVLIWLSFS